MNEDNNKADAVIAMANVLWEVGIRPPDADRDWTWMLDRAQFYVTALADAGLVIVKRGTE